MKTVGLLLAAGHSRRFGPTDKLLALYRGVPLVHHAAEAMRQAGFDGLIAVASKPDVVALLDGFSIIKPDVAVPEQADSLRAGVQAAQVMAADWLLIMLADMPNVSAEHLQAVVKRCGQSGSASTDSMHRSPPACFPASMFGDLMALSGDRGAGALLTDMPTDALVQMPEGALRDIDLPDDLAR